MKLQLFHNDTFPAFDRFVDEFFGGAQAPAAAWLPPVDIVETPEALELRADMPGLKATDLDIKVENGVLTIRGERKDEHENKGATYHTYERRYGTFARSFALPKLIDGENVKAKYLDGVLTLTLPKKPEAKPKAIQVQIE
jgi:HSP20 family protein